MSDDSEFEARLLASSRHDGPSADAAARALRTFLASIEMPAPEAPAPEAPAPAALAAAPVTGPAKWLLVGALGGSLLTLGLTEALRAGSAAPPSPQTPQSVQSAQSVQSLQSAQSAIANAPLAAPVVVSSSTPQATREPLRVPSPRKVAPRPHTPPATEAAPGSAASAQSARLAEEVARVDAARAALARGAHDDALALVRSYRQAFPSGQLARDAEVVAIESLHAKGLVTEASERAAAFLERYPGDPQASRLRAIVR